MQEGDEPAGDPFDRSAGPQMAAHPLAAAGIEVLRPNRRPRAPGRATCLGRQLGVMRELRKHRERLGRAHPRE